MGITLDKILLDAGTSNIAISDGTDTLAINADGSLNATVTATDLDIRDLTHVSDSVKVGDGTDFLAIAADGSIAVTDNGGSLTVDAVDLDIRDLTHASDSIKVGDGTDFLAVNADGSINVQSAGTATINTEAVSVTTTAAEVLATPLSGRRFVNIQNRNDDDIFLVESGATAKAQGTLIPKNSSAFFEFGENVNIFLVSDSTTADVRLLEIA